MIMSKQGMQAALRAGAAPQSHNVNAFDRGLRADRGSVAISAPPGAKNAASGPNLPPADLLQFVLDGPVRDVARRLRLSLGAVHQLRHGYWPADSRRLMRAWSEYKGRTARVASSWFLRRVRSDGSIAHRGLAWTGMGLAQHVGELVAVARMPDGALLAQTLALPAQRIPLEPRP